MSGIIYISLAIALLSTMDAMAKWIATHGVSVIQILAIRSVIVLLIMVGFLKTRNQLSELKTTRVKWHLFRGTIGFLSPLTYFIGIQRIPLTDAVVLFFSSIFLVTVLSVVFLGEKVGIHRWASIIIGFIGVLIVANPQGGGDLTGYLLVLLGSTTYSILFITGRYLSATESVPSLVFSFNTCVGIISFMLLPWFWQPIEWVDIGLIAILALFAFSGHYFMTMAFASAEVSLIAPFEYSGILWAIAFDLLIWNIMPSMSTMLGAMIIIGSGLYVVHREQFNKARL